MDLEKLSKTQIILLALLVSFVTSIATGITTVTLMDQAPLSVTQPITKVVQNTVEKIIPGETKEIKTTETIIIKEEDLIIEAIGENKNNLVEISRASEEEGEVEILGRGFIVSTDGFVVTDNTLISETGDYSITLGDTMFDVEFLLSDESGFSLLKIIFPEDGFVMSVSPVLVGLDQLNVGQKVIALYGPPINVSTGIISGFIKKTIPTEDLKDSEITEITEIEKILVNLTLSNNQSGSLIINSDGGVIGFAIVRDNETVVIPTNYIVTAIQKLSV